MSSNLRDFEIELARQAGEVDELVERRHRALALAALSGVVMMSPVDEGTFRGNWQVSDGEPAGGPIATVDPLGNVTIAKGADVIGRV
jgi:hypothetical protein